MGLSLKPSMGAARLLKSLAPESIMVQESSAGPAHMQGHYLCWRRRFILDATQTDAKQTSCSHNRDMPAPSPEHSRSRRVLNHQQAQGEAVWGAYIDASMLGECRDGRGHPGDIGGRMVSASTGQCKSLGVRQHDAFVASRDMKQSKMSN